MELIVSATQIQDGYYERADGIIYRRDYVILRKLDQDRYVVIDPDAARKQEPPR